MKTTQTQSIRAKCMAANPEIGTREIRLADILFMMDGILRTPFFSTANEWEMFLFHKWSLTKDDLELQSERTIEFIHNLIETK